MGGLMEHGRAHGTPTICGEGSSCSLSHWVYHCFLTKKIKEMREGLGKNKSEKSAALVKLENQLDMWLEQRSLAQILDWFDCIETTNVRTPMGNYRWSTESVARDRLFLEYLGVPCK